MGHVPQKLVALEYCMKNKLSTLTLPTPCTNNYPDHCFYCPSAPSRTGREQGTFTRGQIGSIPGATPETGQPNPITCRDFNCTSSYCTDRMCEHLVSIAVPIILLGLLQPGC